MAIPVEGYEKYTVDKNGRIYSLISNKYLKPNSNKQGYLSVELFNDKGSKRLLIHRLVAKAFIPNPLNLPQINHKDENPKNNSVDNLEWCTAKYNMNYGIGAIKRHKNIDYSKPCFKINAILNGKKVSKPVMQIDKEGNILNTFISAKEASIVTGVDHSHINHCCNNKRKTAGGFVWKFERSEDLSQFQY